MVLVADARGNVDPIITTAASRLLSVLHLDTFFRLASCPVAFRVKLELPPSLGSPDTLKSPVVLPTP
jgi:hypothetical protein